MAGHYKEVLGLLGEDVEREGLLKTPERVAKAMQFLTKGYHEDPEAVLRSAMFQEEDYKQMVIVKDIDFFSLCEHHMLPFFGKAHVAYIPKKYITGLSKIPRVVDIFARRLQIQERMTMQIKDCIQRTLDPLGVMVVIEAQHMCMQMRGVEKQNSLTTTSDFTGFFQQAKTREEFMNLIKHNADDLIQVGMRTSIGHDQDQFGIVCCHIKSQSLLIWHSHRPQIYRLVYGGDIGWGAYRFLEEYR